MITPNPKYKNDLHGYNEYICIHMRYLNIINKI